MIHIPHGARTGEDANGPAFLVGDYRMGSACRMGTQQRAASLLGMMPQIRPLLLYLIGESGANRPWGRLGGAGVEPSGCGPVR